MFGSETEPLRYEPLNGIHSVHEAKQMVRLGELMTAQTLARREKVSTGALASKYELHRNHIIDQRRLNEIFREAFPV